MVISCHCDKLLRAALNDVRTQIEENPEEFEEVDDTIKSLEDQYPEYFLPPREGPASSSSSTQDIDWSSFPNRSFGCKHLLRFLRLVQLSDVEDMEAQLRAATAAILVSDAAKKVVVSGPGTGKTYLFRKILERTRDRDRSVVLTFINTQ